jgi:hypothetical protein
MRANPLLFIVIIAAIFSISFAAISSNRLNVKNLHTNRPKKQQQLLAKVEETEKKRSNRILPWIPNGIKNAIASYLATVLVKVILQPFDTIKTIQQVQNTQYGIWKTASMFLKERGIGGLWSGTLVSALGASPSVAVYFGVFSSAKATLTSWIPGQYRLLAVALAASIGNSVAAVLRVPYEVSNVLIII